MNNKLYYGIYGKNLIGNELETIRLLSDILKITLLEARTTLNSILKASYHNPVTEKVFNTIKTVIPDLKYTTIESVTQEGLLYGEYGIDKHRLDMAKKWYKKQTPEIQSFVDILIRDGKVVDITENIDWLEEASVKYDTEFIYPTDLKDAIIGINGEYKCFIISQKKVIEIYMSRDGMSYEDAIEYMYYNPMRATEYSDNKIIWLDDLDN